MTNAAAQSAKEQTAANGLAERNELTAILDEIHHHIKNSFQILLSLLSLQARMYTARDPAAMLRGIQGRVRAIANLHDPVYASPDFSSIHFGQYLAALARVLEGMYGLGSRVRLEVSTADLALDISQALPLGLIANELLSNAFEHAFPGSRAGTVCALLNYGASDGAPEAAAPLSCVLTVADNGIGLPAETDPASASSMGLYVVNILTEQLKGRLEIVRNGGSTVRVSFPIRGE